MRRTVLMEKINTETFIGWLNTGILLAQVVLLIFLAIKIQRIESVFFGAAGTMQLGKPISLDATPDERGQVLGAQDAPVTIVEFGDYGCFHCAEARLVVKRILEQYPSKVRFVYRHFPLSAQTFAIAQAAECAAQQGRFWEMHDLLFAHQQNLSMKNAREIAHGLDLDMEAFDGCVQSPNTKNAIEQDLKAGETYNVTGTPTFFVNTLQVIGTGQLEAAVAEAVSAP